MSEPTTPARPDVAPHAAVIELVEQHNDARRYGYTGSESVIRPNKLRIDGVAVWASYDEPVVINEFSVDGSCTHPFGVTVTLQARTLRLGDGPTITEPIEGRDENGGSVIEIPDVEQPPVEGEELSRPYVFLNGRAVYIHGLVAVGKMATDGPYRGLVEVTLTLLCRKLVVDDEPTGLARGGPIQGPGTEGSDEIPAVLTNGH